MDQYCSYSVFLVGWLISGLWSRLRTRAKSGADNFAHGRSWPWSTWLKGLTRHWWLGPSRCRPRTPMCTVHPPVRVKHDCSFWSTKLLSSSEGLSARQTSQMSQHSELSFLHDKCHNINLNINNKRQITTNVIEVFLVRMTNVINVTKWTHQVIIILCEQ